MRIQIPFLLKIPLYCQSPYALDTVLPVPYILKLIQNAPVVPPPLAGAGYFFLYF
jgi:hypothetical protein